MAGLFTPGGRFGISALLLLLVLMVLLIGVLGFVAYERHQQVVRLEQTLGSRWVSEFSFNVLISTERVSQRFTTLAESDEASAEDIEYIWQSLQRQMAFLNNEIGGFRSTYPGSSLETPRQYIRYLENVQSQVRTLGEASDGIRVLNDDDQERLRGYGEAFSELVLMIREHFPEWNEGYPQHLSSYYRDHFSSRAFMTSELWQGLIAVWEAWAQDRYRTGRL